MAVTRVGTAELITYTTTSGTDTYTAEAGSNRLVVLRGLIGGYAVNFTPVMGAQAFTLGAIIRQANNESNQTGVWYIKEADIPSGAQIIDLGEDASFSTANLLLETLQDTSQSSGPTSTSDAVAGDPAFALDYTGVTDGFATGVVVDTNITVTDVDWTEDYEVGSNLGFFKYRTTVSGADTWDLSSPVSRDWGGVILVVEPVAAASSDSAQRGMPRGVGRGINRGII